MKVGELLARVWGLYGFVPDNREYGIIGIHRLKRKLAIQLNRIETSAFKDGPRLGLGVRPQC